MNLDQALFDTLHKVKNEFEMQVEHIDVAIFSMIWKEMHAQKNVYCVCKFLLLWVHISSLWQFFVVHTE